MIQTRPGDAPPGLARRLLWFVGLWAAGVTLCAQFFWK